jgi:hypothetical protein
MDDEDDGILHSKGLPLWSGSIFLSCAGRVKCSLWEAEKKAAATLRAASRTKKSSSVHQSNVKELPRPCLDRWRERLHSPCHFPPRGLHSITRHTPAAAAHARPLSRTTAPSPSPSPSRRNRTLFTPVSTKTQKSHGSHLGHARAASRTPNLPSSSTLPS